MRRALGQQRTGRRILDAAGGMVGDFLARRIERRAPQGQEVGCDNVIVCHAAAGFSASCSMTNCAQVHLAHRMVKPEEVQCRTTQRFHRNDFLIHSRVTGKTRQDS